MRIDNDANTTTIPAEAPSTTPTEAKPVAENKAKADELAPEAPAEKKPRRQKFTGRLKQQKTAKPASKAKAKAAPKSKPAARKPAKTAKPKKAAPKAEATADRRPSLRDNQVIRVLPAGKENPRRSGTVQWEQYEVIRKSDGRDVDEVVVRGAPRTAIRYAEDCGLIKVEG